MANLNQSGDTMEMQGSARMPYILKNVGGVLSCSCPAWRNQSKPIEARTCKHLKKVRGIAAEEARVGAALAPRTRTVTPQPVNERAATTKAAQRQQEGTKLRPDEKAKLFGPPVLLAHKWDGKRDVIGWWMSEKLDGVRAYWNGSEFVTRQGNIYRAPSWFTKGLPSLPLDGELWMGRQRFPETISVVKRHDAGEEWRQIRFLVFDAPEVEGGFERRIAQAERMIERCEFAGIVIHRAVMSAEDLQRSLDITVEKGGEGLMLRQPGSAYEVGRSNTLLKVKPANDAEAIVVEHVAGKGRHEGRLGGLVVRMPSGKTFNLGTGMSDAQREDPPAIGATVTYTYTELTKDGIPKCAAFVAVRDYE